MRSGMNEEIKKGLVGLLDRDKEKAEAFIYSIISSRGPGSESECTSALNQTLPLSNRL